MITEQQQEQATLYAAGALTAAEVQVFEAQLHGNTELRDLVHSLSRATDLMALASPQATLPPALKDKVLRRIAAADNDCNREPFAQVAAALRFVSRDDVSGWKELPVRGAWIKLLSLERERGYAVLLGKLEPGVRYPAHQNVGSEDFYVLTGDLHVGERELRAGDFHHAVAGSHHGENYSVEGCTLLAVLTTDDPLVAFAME